MPHTATYGEFGRSRPVESKNDGGQNTKASTPCTLHGISAGSARACIQTEEILPQTTDRRLLAEVARGSSGALAALYDRLGGPLYSLCLRMVGETGKAEEILQEIFLIIWREAQTYDPTRLSVFSWAVHLTRGQAIGYLRSRGGWSRVASPGNRADVCASSPEHSGQAVAALHAQDKAARDEQAERVRSVLGAMPVEERLAVELVFFRDLSPHDIAARLEQPVRTIKACLKRGLLRLRDGLRSAR